MRTEPQPLLVVDELTVRYRTRTGMFTAVDGASFALAPGERVAIVGESGSGKSTLSSAIAGFVNALDAEVTASTLRFDGADLDRSAAHAFPRRTPGISMVFQDAMTSLDPVFTIGQQLRAVVRRAATTPAERRRGAVDAVAREWVAKVGLRDVDRVLASRPGELSGGMRQRVMLAIALCSRPQLLIADEPTSALDASLSREMMELMVRLTEELGTALIIVSHDIGLCMAFTHRTLVMRGGHLVEDIASNRLRDGAQHPYTQGLIRCIPTLDDVDSVVLPTLDTVALLEQRLAS